MEFFSISTRAKGWVVTFMKMFWRYWTDFSTRKLTARDRRFTMGAAMMGWIYKKVFDRKIEVRLDTRLDELVVTNGEVSGVRVSHFRSEEHTSELQSLMRISYAVFCLKKKKKNSNKHTKTNDQTS